MARTDPDKLLARITAVSRKRADAQQNVIRTYDELRELFEEGNAAGLTCQQMGLACEPVMREGSVATALRRRREGGRRDSE